MTNKRLIVYWSTFPGYASDCVERVRRAHGFKTLVLYSRANPDVEYDIERFEYQGDSLDVTSKGSSEIQDVVRRFDPGAALVGGWRGYGFAVAKAAKALGAPVIGMVDHVGRGALGLLALRIFRAVMLDDLYDGFWVPGRRARRQLARCGVPAGRLREGMYSVVLERYSVVATSPASASRTFLFVGRYLPLKGVRELLNFQSPSNM